MKAFVTYLSSDDYFIGVLTLYKSYLDMKSKHGFFCIVTSNISEHIIEDFRKRKIGIIYTNRLQLPSNLIHYNNSNCEGSITLLENYFNKLVIFGLDKFEKIIYMDADMIMIQNIDELFEAPHMSAVPNHKEDDRWLLNSGLMVIEPSKDLFKDIYSKLTQFTQQEFYEGANKHHHCLWDQDYINMYFNNWDSMGAEKLSVVYNSFTSAFSLYGIQKEELKVAHLVRTKPWLMSPNELYNVIINNEYESGFIYKRFLYYLQQVLLEMSA
jgi:glycogenin glucosyltransferase